MMASSMASCSSPAHLHRSTVAAHAARLLPHDDTTTPIDPDLDVHAGDLTPHRAAGQFQPIDDGTVIEVVAGQIEHLAFAGTEPDRRSALARSTPPAAIEPKIIRERQKTPAAFADEAATIQVRSFSLAMRSLDADAHS